MMDIHGPNLNPTNREDLLKRNLSAISSLAPRIKEWTLSLQEYLITLEF